MTKLIIIIRHIGQTVYCSYTVLLAFLIRFISWFYHIVIAIAVIAIANLTRIFDIFIYSISILILQLRRYINLLYCKFNNNNILSNIPKSPEFISTSLESSFSFFNLFSMLRSSKNRCLKGKGLGLGSGGNIKFFNYSCSNLYNTELKKKFFIFS